MTCTGAIPDSLQSVIDVLEASTPLAYYEVSTDLTGYALGDYWVQVTETIGGETQVEGRLWSLRYQIDVYAPSQGEARDGCCAAQAALVAALNHHGDGGVFTRVETVAPPYNLTDYVNNSPRYICVMAITVRREP